MGLDTRCRRRAASCIPCQMCRLSIAVIYRPQGPGYLQGKRRNYPRLMLKAGDTDATKTEAENIDRPNSGRSKWMLGHFRPVSGRAGDGRILGRMGRGVAPGRPLPDTANAAQKWTHRAYTKLSARQTFSANGIGASHAQPGVVFLCRKAPARSLVPGETVHLLRRPISPDQVLS